MAIAPLISVVQAVMVCLVAIYPEIIMSCALVLARACFNVSALFGGSGCETHPN